MKPKIALLAGGYTGEAAVSFNSAAFVSKQIDASEFDLYVLSITLDGWNYRDERGDVHQIDRSDFSLYIAGCKITFDLAFIMIHGSPGEDGRLQAYFDLIGLPYASSGTLCSALTMNKAYTKMVLQDIENLYVARSVLLKPEQRETAENQVLHGLNLPVFVKPNAGGSSIGMSKVQQAQQLGKALDLAFSTVNTAQEVLVEEFIEGREFSVGAYRAEGKLHVLPSTEVIPKNEFFDYQAKYEPGSTLEITPAELNQSQVKRVEEIVREIYIRLNCKGMVRVDYFLEKDTDRFFFVEINTIPGQTQTSFIPQQVRAYGLSEKEFYTQIILQALLER